MGATGEVSKVSQGVVDALRTQPLSLALIVLNIVFVLFVGLLLYSLNKRTVSQYEAKDKLISQLVQQCKLGTQQ